MKYPHIAAALLGLVHCFAGVPAVAQTGQSAAGGTDRTVIGTLEYLARIALPPDAELHIVVRDLLDRPIATVTQATEGAQVPLPFAVAVTGTGPGALEAMIRVDGRISWIGGPVVVAGGRDDIDLGAIRLEMHRPMAFVSVLRCGDQLLRLGLQGHTTVLRAGGQTQELARIETASGRRFATADGLTEVWTRGDQATVRLDGADLGSCRRAGRDPLPLRASGSDPEWQLAAGGGLIRFRDGPNVHLIALPETEGAADGGWHWRADTASGMFSLTLTPAACPDPATGLALPLRAELALGEIRHEGCAGRMAVALAGVRWQPIEIAGEAVPENVDMALAFNPVGGGVAGRSGCNSFFGAYASDGRRIGFARIGMTQMGCPPDRMALERRFLEALTRADSFAVSADGWLTLTDGRDTVLRARR